MPLAAELVLPVVVAVLPDGAQVGPQIVPLMS